ncbi:MAG: patatin-like phospholipase family protein [Holosporaceae bacterium]|nr:patatin-like phospholipase family protein [Holosporaceae bacterium]
MTTLKRIVCGASVLLLSIFDCQTMENIPHLRDAAVADGCSLSKFESESVQTNFPADEELSDISDLKLKSHRQMRERAYSFDTSQTKYDDGVNPKSTESSRSTGGILPASGSKVTRSEVNLLTKRQRRREICAEESPERFPLLFSACCQTSIAQMCDAQCGPDLERPKIIMSFDGGGIRGVLQIEMIRMLKEKLALKGIPFEFDVVAGTSVGAMNALAVILDEDENLQKRFGQFGRKIFKKARLGFGGLRRPGYVSSGRREAVSTFVKQLRENKQTLGKDLIVPYYEYDIMKPKIYSIGGEKELTQSDIDDIYNVIMASSAAPTYFNPHLWKNARGQTRACGDGGVFANHPGFLAYQSTRLKYPNAPIIEISFGTGSHNSFRPPEYYYNLGLILWAKLLSSITIDAVSYNTDLQLNMLTSVDPKFTYYRLQPTLELEDMVMDDVSPEHVERLKNAAIRALEGPEQPRFNAVIEAFRQRANPSCWRQ